MNNLLRKLNGIKHHKYVNRTKEILQFSYTIFAIAVTFILIGVFLSWLHKPSAVSNVVSYAHYSIYPNQSIYLSSPLSFKSRPGKAMYQAWVKDEHGDTIYTYPPLKLSSDSPIDLSLYFPPMALLPGTYTVSGVLTYSDNPITTSSINIEFGRVTIKGKEIDNSKPN